MFTVISLSRIHKFLPLSNIAVDHLFGKTFTWYSHRGYVSGVAMAVVSFVSHDGEKHEVPLEEGRSLMQVATNNAVPGIDGDCGGEAACGTCHVIVDPHWIEQVGFSGPEEEEMLAMNPERQQTSRLSCQMIASAGWDGLTVQLPEFQM
jgi:ferredoxin, 2Fe-2S